MSEPSPEQSFFSIHLKSLTDFADEFLTQIQSLQAPMDHLATMAATPPLYGAFHEAWNLGTGEQAAIEEMYSLLNRVKGAIGFAGDVTGTVADGYRNADQDVSSGLGGPGGGYGNGPGGGNPWSGNGQGNGNGNGQNPWGDPHQGTQNDQPVYATPVSNSGFGVPNQNTSGPFAGSPLTSIPVVGALLGGTLLAGAAKGKSHQPPAGTPADVSVSVDAGSSAQSGALPLWTPPPDPGVSGMVPPAAAPAPVFPGQDSSWTAATPQGGS